MTDPRMTWYMITYAGTHASEQAFWPIFVCDGLADRYRNHFKRKGVPIHVKEVVSASIDFGGIVRQDAEYLPFDLGGFTLEIMGGGATARACLAAPHERSRIYMKVYRIVVETYEVGAPYPILTHVFQGKDEEQTLGFIAAHRKYDQFFRECGMGVFAGRIRCHNVTRVVGWVDAHR